MKKIKILYRKFSSKNCGSTTTEFTEQDLTVFNNVAHQRILASNDQGTNVNNQTFYILDHLSNRVGANALTREQLRNHYNTFYPERASSGNFTPRTVSQIGILEDNGTSVIPNGNTTLMNLVPGTGGSFQNALIIPVPSVPLEQEGELHRGYSALVTRYFSNGDIFNRDVTNRYEFFRALSETLRIEAGLNVNFSTLRAYQMGIQGTLGSDFYTYYFGRFRNIALVLDFFSTRALDLLTQTFSYSFNSVSDESLMIFSIFTVSFMGLWVMTLPLNDLFVIPFHVFYRELRAVANQIVVDRFRIEQLRGIRSYVVRRGENLTEQLESARVVLQEASEDFVREIRELRVNSSRERWYQFFVRWALYLYSLPVTGGVVWLYFNPTANRIIRVLLSRLYAWYAAPGVPVPDTTLDEEILVQELVTHLTDHGQAYIDFLFAYF